MKNISFAILIFTALCAAECRADLGSLIDLARGQSAMQEGYKKDTRRFERVKSAVEAGTIRKGRPKDEIEDVYGRPVVVLEARQGEREKWIYKPASSSFFKGRQNGQPASG